MIIKLSHKVVTLPPWLTMSSLPVTTSNGTITGKSDLQCKIKETLLIGELKPSLNENVGSEKLFLY